MLKFVKYLPELGWDVTVLTSRSAWYGVRDVSQLAEIPDTVRVVRAGEVPSRRSAAGCSIRCIVSDSAR